MYIELINKNENNSNGISAQVLYPKCFSKPGELFPGKRKRFLEGAGKSKKEGDEKSRPSSSFRHGLLLAGVKRGRESRGATKASGPRGPCPKQRHLEELDRPSAGEPALNGACSCSGKIICTGDGKIT